MNAFGKRGGMGGSGRPQFGVAKPMKSSGGAAAAAPDVPDEAEQFPPVSDLTANLDGSQQDSNGTADGRDGPPQQPPECQRRSRQQQDRRL